MKIAPLTDVKTNLSFYVEQAEKEGPVVITRNGRAVAVINAPVDDEDLESLLLTRSPRFQALIERSRKSHNTGKGLSSEQFWKAVNERSGEYKTK